MKSPITIDDYMAKLAREMPRGNRSERILLEIECHLRDRTEKLCSNGQSQREAEAAAIAQFGTQEQILQEFSVQAPIESEEFIMLRSTLTVLVALTGVYAALHAVFAFPNEGSALWAGAKILAATYVIGYGILVLFWLRDRRQMSETLRVILFIGGLGLIELGTANVVWTAHLGLVTGDWEYYGFVGGALISMLGALPAIWLVLLADSNQIARKC